MIRAKYSNQFVNLFYRYLRLSFKQNFKDLHILGDWDANPNHSAMIFGNHISWWDGFWALHLVKKKLKKRMYVMMLEEQLKQFLFFKRIGAFSIKPNGREIIESLKYAGSLLNDNKNAVLIYPQGKINSLYTSNVKFERGYQQILKDNEKVDVLFYAAFIEYMNVKKPSVYFYLKKCSWPVHFDDMELEYQQFYMESLQKQQKKST